MRARMILWASVSFIRLKRNCGGGIGLLCGSLSSVCVAGMGEGWEASLWETGRWRWK